MDVLVAYDAPNRYFRSTGDSQPLPLSDARIIAGSVYRLPVAGEYAARPCFAAGGRSGAAIDRAGASEEPSLKLSRWHQSGRNTLIRQRDRFGA